MQGLAIRRSTTPTTRVDLRSRLFAFRAHRTMCGDIDAFIGLREMRIQQFAGPAGAVLFAGLAPALVMAALWHTSKTAPLAFTFTFAIALGHAVFLGLPLFLVFRSTGWINGVSCIVVGFVVGAVPAGILTWPMHHPGLHTSASVAAVPTTINAVITAAGWVNYVKPLFYFGLFGALGGFAFWVTLTWSATFGKAAAAVSRS